MSIKYNTDTSAILKKLYPLVEESLSKSSTINNYKKLINDFISNRTEYLYDSLPCDRIVCSEAEMNRIFDAIKISKTTVSDIIKETYFGNIDHFTPLCAKHEFTILLITMIRYFFIKNMKKECDLAVIHLSFSGKFYPSLHYRSYPTVVPVRHVMEYVVNTKLTRKYDLVVQGNVIGAVKSIGDTWIDSYKDKFKSFSDDDVVYLLQQLYSRIGSFIKNIATEYYDTYEDKDAYMTYSSDNFDSEDFHLADSDTLKVGRAVEKTINRINSYGVEGKVCKMCSNDDITPNECKAVIESILMTNSNIPTIKELISLMISLYLSSGEKDVADIKFITYTIAPKPNAKQKEILRMKEIIENWLCESGTAYMRRRSRVATKNSYERCVKMYFALTIHNANR